MHNQLQKAINLVNKTGDRLLVVDMANPEQVFAVMSIDEYEKLVIGRSDVIGLTENELLDKINRDIAIWKSDNEFSEGKNKGLAQAQKYLSNIKDKKAFLGNFDFENNPDFYGEDDKYGFIDESDEPFGEWEDNEIYEKIETGFKKERENNSERKNPWAIPPTRKEAAEKAIDEDTQYLEEVS